MFDLLALAYQADLTRVFTFMMARELSQRTYPQIGVTEPHHTVSHHGNNPERIAEHAKVNTYHAGLFAKFLERLRRRPDGDGSLLDHSIIVYGSGMSNGNGHTPYPLPHVVVGGGAGHQRQPPRRCAGAIAEREPDAGRGGQVRDGARSVRGEHGTSRAVAGGNKAAMKVTSEIVRPL